MCSQYAVKCLYLYDSLNKVKVCVPFLSSVDMWQYKCSRKHSHRPSLPGRTNSFVNNDLLFITRPLRQKSLTCIMCIICEQKKLIHQHCSWPCVWFCGLMPSLFCVPPAGGCSNTTGLGVFHNLDRKNRSAGQQCDPSQHSDHQWRTGKSGHQLCAKNSMLFS